MGPTLILRAIKIKINPMEIKIHKSCCPRPYTIYTLNWEKVSGYS